MPTNSPQVICLLSFSASLRYSSSLRSLGCLLYSLGSLRSLLNPLCPLGSLLDPLGSLRSLLDSVLCPPGPASAPVSVHWSRDHLILLLIHLHRDWPGPSWLLLLLSYIGW